MALTEFIELDPSTFHLVPKGATGFPVLLAKAAEGVDEIAFEEAIKGLGWDEAHALLSKEIGDAHDEEVLKFVSAADRRKDAKSGVAMPNGDFPIPDEGHLRSAVGHLGNYTGDKGAAKAHIITRARALGLTHLLPEDWNVAKEDTATETEKTVSTGESLSQTREVSDDTAAHGSPEAGDGGDPKHVAAEGERPAPGDGQGDTAPDKTVPTGEALSQTAGAQKAGADSKADDDADDDADDAKSATKDTPGSPTWEAQDASLADRASTLISSANELIEELGNRERAEKGIPFFSPETEGAIRRSTQTLVGLLPPQPVEKETIDMDKDELIKLLDERDEARRVAKRARKTEEADAAAKAAAATGGTTDETAKGAIAPEAADGGAVTLEGLAKVVTDLAAVVAKIADEPVRGPMLNEAGASAAKATPVLRGEGTAVDPENAFKELEDRIEAAKTPAEKEALRQELTKAKFIANEQAREANPALGRTAFGPSATPLLSNRHALPDDPTITGVGSGRR